MSVLRKNTEIITQRHYGPGDNVGRDKITIVYQSIAPKALRKTIESILSELRSKKLEKAKTILETAKTIEGLELDSKAILDMLSIHIDLIEDKSKPEAYETLTSFLRDSDENLPCDLCLAALIHLDAKNDRIDEAKERYNKAESLGRYSQEAFSKFIATADELEKEYDNNGIHLGEIELNGIAVGSIRTHSFGLALKSAIRLDELFPSFNSKVLKLLAKAFGLNTKIANKHYWSITRSLKTEGIEIANEALSLINESNGDDSRLFNIIVPTFQYTLSENEEIADICWKYIDKVQKIMPEVAADIRSIYAKDISGLEGNRYRLEKAYNDKEYRAKLLKQILLLDKISADDFVVLSNFADPKSLEKWVASGGMVSGKNDIETDFIHLELRLLTISDKTDSDAIDQTRSLARRFINKYQDKLSGLNPQRVLKLAGFFSYYDLSLIACDFIKPLLPESDLWVSPIVRCYLNCLLSSQQMKTLTLVLANIPHSESDTFIWQIKSSQLGWKGEYKKAIEQNLYSLESWHFLIFLHKKLETSEEALLSVLKRIPDKVLSKRSKMALPLLLEIARTGEFTRSEKFIISWFIENPTACAVPVTSFHFTLTLHCGVRPTPTFEKVGECFCGVKFRKDNEELTRLLVYKKTHMHDCLLDINSPLGTLLKKMKLGETRQNGMEEITLIERLPPYIGIFRVSMELRHSLNDGTDCFHLFTLPKDPDEMVAFLERKFSGIDTEWQNSIISNPKIPLMIKGQKLHPDNPVSAVLELFSGKEPFKDMLPNFGEKNSSQFIADIYSIMYLAITGLAHGIEKISVKLVITAETKIIIESWLKGIKDENYGKIGVTNRGGIWTQNAEEIKQTSKDIQEALALILSKSVILSHELVDAPFLLLRIQPLVDISVYSSIMLSISNDIPWLCIDEKLAYLLRDSGCKIINSFTLFSELGQNVDFKLKKYGLYLHAMKCIPYVVTFHDLILMSISDDKYAHYFLAEILFFYPKAYSDTKSAVKFLSRLFVPVIAKGYLNREFLKGLSVNNPANSGHTEKMFNTCCYISMQCDDGSEAEFKLSMLLYRIFEQFEDIPPLITIIEIMASRFIEGHFLSLSAVNNHIRELCKT